MGESCLPTRASEQVFCFQVRRAPYGKLAAKSEEGASELDQGLIVQVCRLDALTVDERAILGAEVTNRPAVLLAAELGVGLGHPAVRQLEAEGSVRGHARHPPPAAAQP